MESSHSGHDASWTPPRFELGGPVDDAAVPRRPAPPPAPAKRRSPPRPAASRAAADRRNGAPSRNSGTLLALVFLIAMAGGLIALVAMVMPLVLWLVAVVLGFIALGAFHYLLWGWWAAPPAADISLDEESPLPRAEYQSRR